jgi:deazaflavin-dependent oxidoreductase (nitroreductase family)
MSDTAVDDGKRSAGAPPPRWLLKAFTRTHVLLNRLSGGALFNKMGGDEICFVSMTGAKSGRRITIPLMYIPYRQGVLLVASQGGAPRNPVWYHNLVANPGIEVRHRGERRHLRARLAEPDEKPDLWPICYRAYAPYEEYRKRTDRDIPIFVCEPAA